MVNPEPQHSGSGTQERMVATPRVVTRVDDLDGSGDAHTVRVGLDGQAYEIDLTDAHAHHSARCWPPYVSAGRRLTRSSRPYTRTDLDTGTTGPGRRVHRRRG
jgi:hypothetical protein